MCSRGIYDLIVSLRCDEVYEACSSILGGESDKSVVLHGMLETMGRKFNSAQVINSLSSSSKYMKT